MEIADFFNADTVKLTLIPGIVVALVLFFWFRRTAPKAPPRSRELARGRAESTDPLLNEADQWEVGEVRVLAEDERREAWQASRMETEAEMEPMIHDSPREPRSRASTPSTGAADRLASASLSIEQDRRQNEQDRPEREIPAQVYAPKPVAALGANYASDSEPPASSPQPPSAPAPKERMRQQQQQNAPIPRQNEAVGLMLVLNIVVNGRHLRGAPILKAVTAAGLTYGKMGIFHYYAPSRQGRQPLFSLANMVEPGNFNLATMDEVATPGLTLFANVTNPDEGVSTFNAMLETARKLADALHATVCDERRSTLSRQGIEHIHGRIQDFQRRSRLAHAANA